MTFSGRNRAHFLRPRLRLAWLRGTALCCVLLLAAASGRGMVTGLCTNLVAGETSCVVVQAADAYVGPAAMCCLELLRSGACRTKGGSGHVPAGLRDCAFCTLAMARVEPLEYVTLPVPPAMPAFVIAERAHDLAVQDAPRALCVRGPPASLVS